MGLIEQILSPDPLVPGEGEAGDAFSIKIGQPPAAFNFEAFFVNIGTQGKQFTEVASFQRFVLDTPKPSGATVTKWKVSMHGLSRQDGDLQVRLGLLQADGIWDLFGFRHHGTLGYPSLNELPFGTNDATDAINAGVLLGDRFLGGGSGRVITTDGGWLNRQNTIGEGYSGLDEILVGSTADLETHLNSLATMLAFTLDPFDENDQPLTSIAFASEDHPTSALRPLLFIEWEENPPTITSAPGPGVGSPGVLYDFGPLTANDPAPGNSATVTFDLVDPEDGMTVILDGGTWRFDWTPSLTAPAVYTVKLQATDEDGFTSAIQQWIVVIQPDGVPGEVCSELEITKAVSGSIEVTEGVGGSIEVGVAIASVLDVSPSVDGTLEITPTVEGTLEVEKCR